MSDVIETVFAAARTAKEAYRVVSEADSNQKNAALLRLAELLEENRSVIQAANEEDVAAARVQGLSDALLDRLHLSKNALNTMIEGVRQVAALPDPVGRISDLVLRPSGIQVGRMRVPLGVIGMVYEARPNVTIEAASLCLKSGNACILRGGSEAIRCNRVLAGLIGEALSHVGLPETAVQLIDSTDREAVGAMLSAGAWIDVMIPRGGRSLVERVSREAKMPVIKHLDGVCHLYVDNETDVYGAAALAVNAKTSRYGACNSLETLLVHREIAASFLPLLAEKMAKEGVVLRACADSMVYLPQAEAATEEDWSAEYLAPVLAVRLVEDIREAVAHINCYGSGHTDSIATESYTKARYFLRAVDSASVMVNASTRFADGFEYGLGAEIGISTDRIHVRGPVGLEGLTSEKWVVLGDYTLRG